jgi:flagellar biosynthesis/type III secretory pathway protein FliH
MVLFAEDFDLPPGAEAEPADPATPEIAEPPIDLDAVRATAYAQAARDAEVTSVQQRTDRLVSLAVLCEQKMQDAQKQADELADETATAIARLIFQGLEKVIPAIARKFAAAEIAALCASILPSLRSEPRTVIRMNPHDVMIVEAELRKLPAEQRDNITLAPTDSVAEGDIQITWRDGSATRDTADVWRQVSETLQQFGLLDAPTGEPGKR